MRKGSRRMARQLPKAFRSLLKLGIFGSVGILGFQLVIALAIVETLIHPKRRTVFDLYTLSPYEFGCPAEAVTFPPLHGNYQVSGWYLSHPEATTTILLCPGYRCQTSYVMAMAV